MEHGHRIVRALLDPLRAAGVRMLSRSSARSASDGRYSAGGGIVLQVSATSCAIAPPTASG